MKEDVEAKPKVMAAQRKLLETRYDLKPKLDPEAKMSRGKPLAVGPDGAARRRDDLGEAGPDDARGDPQDGRVPVPVAAAPQADAPAGRSSRRCRSRCSRGCERFDVDFDLPDAFLPEFPPAIFLQNRPELGDVSRGEVVSINNYYRLFKDILTPVQLDGLRLLLTPLPQEEFNPTDDRKSRAAEPGRDLPRLPRQRPHDGAVPPQPGRPARSSAASGWTRSSLRGVFNQQIHGSKRSLRSVEDFTEFEQRTAYFNGDPIHAMKKGFMIISTASRSRTWRRCRTCSTSRRRRSSTACGRLIPTKATESGAARREAVLRQGAVRRLPPAAVLPGQPDARPAPGALPRRAAATGRSRPSRCAASRTARRTCTTAAADAGGHGRVLQPRAGAALEAQEKRDLVAFMRALWNRKTKRRITKARKYENTKKDRRIVVSWVSALGKDPVQQLFLSFSCFRTFVLS